MKKNTQLILCSLLAVSLCYAPLSAKSGKPADKEKTEQEDSTKLDDKYAEFFKEKPETHTGFINVHKLKGKVYFEVPTSMLGREMLVGSTVTETSDNGDALIGSKPNSPLHITFAKLGDKINILQVSKDLITDSDRPALKEALDKNSAGTIMESFDIHSYNPDSTAILFDITKFFVSDIKQMRPFDPYGVNTYGGMAKRNAFYQSDKSFLGEVKAFENNLSVTSHLSYKYSIDYGGRSLAEDVPFTAVLTRSFLLLDEKPFRPRPTDSRIGIFPTGKYFFSEKAQETQIVYFANRWRMEPSDTAAYKRGELVEPVKPIVFYIDPAFPESWRPAIFEAVNQWQEPFEKIGFKNAVMAKEYPQDDPNFDPDNIMYNCIRYSPIAVQNAMGPSWVDPRSGEVINASVYVYHDIVKLVNNWRYIQTAQTEEAVRSGKLPDDLLHDALSYVIGHEVGHCLGLMHNMSSSSTIPVDSLRSPTFTQKYGTTHSIMDYARFNYVAQPGDKERGVKLTPPKFGLYDYFTIKYAYTPVFDATPEEEAEIVSGWLTEAVADPVYRYGKQQMSPMDPRSQNEDLGDNNVKASNYGISNLKLIMDHFNDWVKDDADFSYRKDIYTGLIYQYLTYIQHVYANIGGIYLNEKHDGDPVDYAYCCVPGERQKEAFEFMCQQLEGLEWLDNEEVMKNIQIIANPSELFKPVIAEGVIAAPFKIASTQKMSHGEDIYTASECLQDVYDFVWTPTRKGQELNDVQMMLQREWLRTICAGVGFSYKGAGARTVGITGTPATADPYALKVPEFLKEYELRNDVCGIHSAVEARSFSPVAGYESPYTMFITPPVLDAQYYDLFTQAHQLIQKKVKSAKGATKAHYELLLHNIEQTIK